MVSWVRSRQVHFYFWLNNSAIEAKRVSRPDDNVPIKGTKTKFLFNTRSIHLILLLFNSINDSSASPHFLSSIDPFDTCSWLIQDWHIHERGNEMKTIFEGLKIFCWAMLPSTPSISLLDRANILTKVAPLQVVKF